MEHEPITSVQVDCQSCIWHYFCVEECPEVLEIDRVTEKAVVRRDAHRWFESKAEEIRFAAKVCPVDAVLINGKPPGRTQ